MSNDVRPGSELPAWPQYGDEEREGLIRALDQGQWWHIGGGEVGAFEAEFAAAHGSEHALAVSNGTHALELALEVLGVGAGTEVIVPAFTFISPSQAGERHAPVVEPGRTIISTTTIAQSRLKTPVSMASRAATGESPWWPCPGAR